MRFIRTYSLYIILAAFSFFAIAPLLQPGFFPVHDDEQVGRLYELDQSLKAGHFPVRISQNLGFGYGYPLFNFYPSFVYYVGEIFSLAGFGYIDSIKLMIGLGFLLSAFFMYLFSKEYLGKYGGFVAAIAYTYVPYHAVDVYVRGALPEFWSFVFIPAIFWSYKKLAETQKSYYVFLSAIAIACLIFTHNLVAMMSGVFIAAYVIFLLSGQVKKKSFLTKVFLSGLIGMSLSASFWIPSFFERNTTMIRILTTEFADYNQHFVYIRQFWSSPWGYGGSLIGPDDGLTFQIGKIHIIGSILSLVLSIWLFIRKDVRWKIVTLFFCSFLFASFMMVFRSKFIWDNLSFFSYIQFPWRFLLFTAFTSSFLVGALVLIFKSEKAKIIVSLILSLFIIVLYKDFFVPRSYPISTVDKDYIDHDVIKWKTSMMAFEYSPDGIATKKVDGITKIDITEDQVATKSYRVIRGDIAVKEEVIKPHYKKLIVDGSGGILRINQFSYPGWKVFIDEQEISYSDNNKFKLLDVNVPSGKHTIEATYTDTPARTIGNALSGASIIGILLYIILILAKKTKKDNHEKSKKAKKT